MRELEVDAFTDAMQHEITANSGKGNWRDFTKPGDILLELQYHQAKLLIAMRDRTKCSEADLPEANAKVLELAADCANHYLFLTNALGVLPV